MVKDPPSTNAGYDYAAAMHSSDWERFEEREPPNSGASEVAANAVVADAVLEPSSVVVEVVEEEEQGGGSSGGSLGNGNGTSSV